MLIGKPQYFDIFRALHRGGLSLWLNRRTLLPMTVVPTIVTFLTLMVMRINFPDGGDMPSAFVMALMQVPSDFVTGIFCSLIIFIIVKAPKKKDKDAPVMFTLNIMERKDLLIAGAVAYVVFSYLSAGALGVMQMVFEPISAAAEQNQPPSTPMVVVLFALFGFIFFAMRFLVLPVLIIAGVDLKSFFKRYKSFTFSVPVFLIKMVTTIVVSMVVLGIGTSVASLFAVDGGVTPTQMAIIDAATAFGSVMAAAWSMAALAIGLRKMLEGDE